MDMQSPGQKQTEINKTVATTTSSAAIPIATVSSSHPACTQATSASLSVIQPVRQSIQVIQQAIHRPQSIAAQYLHQMYAAQQQHLMLQTAALQQRQHTPHLQSLATTQQASVCQRQPPSSSSGTLAPPPAVVSQNPVTLPASPVAAQLIARSQNSTATTTAISQQAMLLGNRPANCNQTQMYLRTQMLILTPTVQSDLPAVTSSSSLHPSAQVHSLALRAQLPRTLAAARSVILKPSVQSQAVSPATSVPKTAICALKAKQQCDAATEAGLPEVTRLPPGHQLLATGCSPAQMHTLVQQQLSCPPGQQASQHRVILQATGGAPNNRQFQPFALRASPQEDNSSHQAAPTMKSQPSNNGQTPSSPSVASMSAQTPIQNAPAKLQPPPLVAAPHRRTSVPAVQNQPLPPPPPLVLPRLPQNPPAAPQRLSLHSVQALAVQSGRVLLTEHELPVAEALIQMPYQNLPPPQTVAVDLKVHPVRQSKTPTETCTVNGLRSEERKEQRSPSPQWRRTTTPPTACPKENGEAAVMGSPSTLSGHSVIRSPAVEESPQVTSSTTPPPLPSILPAAVTSSSHPPTPPASAPGSPEKLLRSQILTHLIEGFIIQEGLEPFPVGHSAAEHQATLPESQEMQTNGDAAPEDGLQDAEQSDSTDWEMQNNSPAADELRENESAAGVLQCEQCGSPGYARTFLCSKRFCSLTCVRRSRVRCTKRITMLRAGRWAPGFIGRRGRPPGRISGASRENVLRQTYRTFGSEDTHQGSPRVEEEEEPAIPPMTTRLRKQTERARERQRVQEREQEQRMTEPPSVCDGEEELGRPLHWNVEQVFSYINSLPEGQDVAREFRCQEIDGQALLLLTEDHLISTMNLKLGPALKLCAHINSLKEA